MMQKHNMTENYTHWQQEVKWIIKKIKGKLIGLMIHQNKQD